VQKRQQKKKKRRTANSYSDISFNDKYKLTEELLGTGAHGYKTKFHSKEKRICVFFLRLLEWSKRVAIE
jgi:chromatin segregation and condensation protein Rec8/ScpA/Scc1 (kleisin family)